MKIYSPEVQLALVDIRLPDGDGFQFCDWLRTNQNELQIPIIFISSNNSVESRITGFSVGGDDYISKPFNFVELQSRIEAKLRRNNKNMSFSLNMNGIGVDLRSQKAQVVEKDGLVELDLTPIEFKILNLLLSEPEKVFPRDEILNKIWGKNVYVYPRSVDTHVSKLRAKLGEKSYCIRSIHGTGYKFSSQAQNASA